MTPPVSIRGQICPNPACRGGGKPVVHSRAERRLRCTACGATWVERRGTAAYRVQHDLAVVASVLDRLAAGESVRRTARAAGVSTSTVRRWRRRFEQFSPPTSHA
jgi:transposase-like protein